MNTQSNPTDFRDPLNKKEIIQKTLTKFSKETEEEQASLLAKKHQLPYLDLNLFFIQANEVKLLAEKEALKYHAAIFQKIGKEIRVAITQPQSKETFDFFNAFAQKNGWQARFFVVSNSSLSKVLKKYSSEDLLDNLNLIKVSLHKENLEKFEKDFKNLLDLKNRILEIPITQVIDTILAGAIKMNASDIHLEPEEKELRIRYRLDGILHSIGAFPLKAHRSLITRIKIMGGMKINIHETAQDGSFSFDLEQHKIDARVSIIPGNFGESAVIRLLDQSQTLLQIEELGLRGLAYEEIKRQINRPNGMILTTGPTGSGKTTSLYAFINRINTPNVKIITIEDPIEYQIKGISQTQVSPENGYTFANGLRAIVRQDPDVILISEIRDDETADIAINSALTGHLVLSTLHTKGASASISRLLELRIRPSLISSSLNTIISQRLVRRLCLHCREEYVPAPETVDWIKKIISLISPKSKVEIPKKIEKLYRAKGCAYCNGTGYKGRIGIFEVLSINEKISDLIRNMESEKKISEAAIEEGMITMVQDGILKAIEGNTSIEEIWRVTDQADFLEKIYEKLMEQSLARSIQIKEKDLKTVSEHIISFEKLKTFLENLKTEDLLRYVLAGALLINASDIHLEPTEKNVLIRMRLDGVLQNIASFPLTEYPSLLGNIKTLSGLLYEQQAGIQDSRFSVDLEKPFGKLTMLKNDIRVSIILGGYGETAVLRILNQNFSKIGIESLGIRQENLKKIKKEIHKPYGLFLNTGPTGSGKTTTLYEILKILNKPEIKIITIEDPIEYRLDGIIQTQINEENGYTFSSALRSILRQNPNVIMLGEIRDEETAQMAIQAALTGHLVLSTLHTNDAAGAISRFINLGVRSDDLTTSVGSFMAQRLVRKLCDCKIKTELSVSEKEKIKKALSTISPQAKIKIPQIKYAYRPNGCPKCNGIGYKGRVAISEILTVNDKIKEMINNGDPVYKIKKQAQEDGMITMFQDGVLKVLEGETTLEEVEKVTGE